MFAGFFLAKYFITLESSPRLGEDLTRLFILLTSNYHSGDMSDKIKMLSERQACLSARQEKILDFVVREYLSTTEPVGSLALKKVCNIDVSAATIRNELQELTKQGYKHVAEKIAAETEKSHYAKASRDEIFSDFIVRQIKFAHEEMAREMKMMQEIMDTLDKGDMYDIFKILDNVSHSEGFLG